MKSPCRRLAGLSPTMIFVPWCTRRMPAGIPYMDERVPLNSEARVMEQNFMDGDVGMEGVGVNRGSML